MIFLSPSRLMSGYYHQTCSGSIFLNPYSSLIFIINLIRHYDTYSVEAESLNSQKIFELRVPTSDPECIGFLVRALKRNKMEEEEEEKIGEKMLKEEEETEGKEEEEIKRKEEEFELRISGKRKMIL
jgi:hypothetical protein